MFRSTMTSGAMPMLDMERTAGSPAPGTDTEALMWSNGLSFSLLDSSISDDCSCAKIIWQRHGFNAWYNSFADIEKLMKELICKVWLA